MSENKTNYIQLDIAKFMAAILVVAIHIPPFQDVNGTLSMLFQQVICRLAVPFFFVCSGFFLGKKGLDKSSVLSYLKKIGQMYLLWSVLYLPMIIERFWNTDKTIWGNTLELSRRFFLVGSYVQLWYLLATFYGVLLLFLILRMLSRFVSGDFRHTSASVSHWLFFIACVVYIIGLFFNSYGHVLDFIPVIKGAISSYKTLFVTSRNGLFFAFPLLSAGYLIANRQVQNHTKTLFAMSLLSITLLFAEFFALKRWGHITSFDFYLLTPVAVCCIFLCLLTVQMDAKYLSVGKKLRQLSTYIFLLHLMVNFYLKRIPLLGDFMMQHSMLHFLIVLGVSAFIGMALIFPAKRC